MSIAKRLVGTWRLLSRDDVTATGERRVDPHLGADPVALLVYDAAGHFAAQFMKRDRSAVTAPPTASPVHGGANNSTSVGGYDAYFGTYTVDEETSSVTQRLDAALSPGDVGKIVTRGIELEGDRLTIRLQTNAHDGERVTRTLRWERVA